MGLGAVRTALAALAALALSLTVDARLAMDSGPPAWAPPWTPLQWPGTEPSGNATTRRVSVLGQDDDDDDDDFRRQQLMDEAQEARDRRQDAVLASLQRLDPIALRRGPPMLKATLTQIGYIQFLRYVETVPELRELSFCVWLRSRNLTHNHPVFSYSRNERERLARAWVSPAGRGLPPRLHFSVLERLVFVEPLPEATHRRWLHICPSWDGISGHYRLYVDGRGRRTGVRPEVTGLVLPGGGDVVVGQEHTDFNKGLDDGVEGEVFGFYLFRTATPRGPGPALMPSLAEANYGVGVDQADHLRQLLGVRRRRVGEADMAMSAAAPRAKRQQRLRPAWWRGPPAGPPGPSMHGPHAGVPPRIRRLFSHCADPLPPEDRADAVIAWPSTPVRVFGGAMLNGVRGGCGDF